MARNSRNTVEIASKPIKTAASIEATYGRLLEHSIVQARIEVTEARERLNRVMNEINDPGYDVCSLWALESLGDRLEVVTMQSVHLSVLVAVQEEFEANQRNSKSFRDVCYRVRERFMDRALSESHGYSSSEYRNAHNFVKKEALRTSLRDVIQNLGFVINELDAIATVAVEPKPEIVS